MNNSKKLAKISSVLLLAIFVLSGCSFEEGLNGRLEWLDGKASRLFEAGDEDQTVIEAMEGEASDKQPETSDKGQNTKNKQLEIGDQRQNANNLTAEEKSRIDQWLEEQGYNRYGDASNAFYTGGTPLFNEETGQAIDRYDYILNKFPNILERIEE